VPLSTQMIANGKTADVMDRIYAAYVAYKEGK
jgi:hypothetical protein